MLPRQAKLFKLNLSIHGQVCISYQRENKGLKGDFDYLYSSDDPPPPLVPNTFP